MSWDRPIAADSGGFQLYSLIGKSPGSGSVTRKGFVYRTGSKRVVMTPEKCIQTQFRIKADLMFCLDYCTHPEASQEIQRLSVETTVSWATRCRDTYDILADQKSLSPVDRPLLLAVIQGGEDPHLRRECAERLLSIGFDGYAYGGWPVRKGGKLAESVAQVADLTPGDRPRFALGIGKPENLVRAYRCGYHLFDCVIPTRDARHRRLYVFRENSERLSLRDDDFYECLYLQDRKHRTDSGPLEEGCDCLCCQSYSRAYLHHLFRINDALAGRLATIHNLRFYRRLVALLRRGNG
jgi:queuine tRNA-ribosyltransferase